MTKHVNTVAARKGRLVNGVLRTPGQTYDEIRNADPYPGSDDQYGEKPEHMRPGNKFKVPNSIYFSEERARQEEKKIWPATWQMACRMENIPKVGSVFVYDFLTESIMITRVSKTEVKAYRNSCPHRGNQLRKSGSCGVVKKFYCPFHGAMWNLDGSNSHWPMPFDFPHLADTDVSLDEVEVGVFQGFIFVCTGSTKDKAPTFDDFIAPLRKYMTEWSWDNKHMIKHVRQPLNANWKILVQAFNESLHFTATHPQARPFVSVSGTQVDVLSDYITRQISATFVTGDTMPKAIPDYNMLVQSLKIPKEVLASMGIEEGADIRARDVIAELTRAEHEAKTGEKLPADTPTTTLVDNVVFHMFPNSWIVHGLANTGVMRAVPTEDPNKCYFDLMWFRPNVEGETHEAPEMTLMKDGDRICDHWDRETIGGTDGAAADQDTENMEGQQRGLRARPEGNSLYSDYLESAIIHDLAFMERLINDKS